MKKLKKRKALWHKHRDYLQNEVLRLVNKANRGVQPERRVTYAAAIEVANRAIKRNGNVFSSARAFGALRAVNAFIEFATRGKDVVDAYKYADLLPVGHPSSTRSHSMTASALRHARARWYAADPLVDDELRPLVASAHAADYLSPERDYLFARLAAAPRSSLPLWLTLDVAEAIVAGALSFIGGNSSAARRARAQLQRRDRKGQFAFMGGGFSWGIKLGSVFRSLSGRVVGASGDDDVEIEVVDDPDLPDGIYALPAKRGEGVKAILKYKKGAKATNIAIDKDAVDASTLVRKDAPSGWEAVKPKDAQKLLPSAAKLWSSADGYFVEETPEGDKVLRRIDLATNKPGNEVARSKSWADITKGALDDQDDFAKFIEAEAVKERAGAGEAIDLDPAQNITQQVSDAVSSGKKVRFSYGGKERIITPEKISTGEKSGKRNLLGKDTDGNTKSFTLDKIEAPGAPGEQPEVPVSVPDNAVQFDPAGDLDAQLQQAIDNDAPVVFDYNGKTRVVFPQATKDGKPSYYTNPKNGNVNIIGNEAGSEQQKQYTLSKISKAGEGGTPPPTAPTPESGQPRRLPVRGEGKSLSWETSERSGFVSANGENDDTHYLIRPGTDGGYFTVETARTKGGDERRLGPSDTLDEAKQLAQAAEDARVEADKAREFVDISDLVDEFVKMRGENGENGENAATWLKGKLNGRRSKVVVFDYKGKRRAVDIDIAGYYESKYARKNGRGAKLIGFDRESNGNREFFFTEMKPTSDADRGGTPPPPPEAPPTPSAPEPERSGAERAISEWSAVLDRYIDGEIDASEAIDQLGDIIEDAPGVPESRDPDDYSEKNKRTYERLVDDVRNMEVYNMPVETIKSRAAELIRSLYAEEEEEEEEDGTDASEAQRDKRREKFLRDTGEYNTMRMGDDEYDSIVEQILEDGTFSPDEANQIRDAYEERSDAIKAATRIKNDDRKSEAIEKASNDYYDKIADIVEGPEGRDPVEKVAKIVVDELPDFLDDRPMTSSNISKAVREAVEVYTEEYELSPEQASQAIKRVNEMLEGADKDTLEEPSALSRPKTYPPEQVADGEDTFIDAIETMLEEYNPDNLEKTYTRGNFTAVTEAMFPEFVDGNPDVFDDSTGEKAALEKHRERLTELEKLYFDALDTEDVPEGEKLREGLESFLAELKAERAKRGDDEDRTPGPGEPRTPEELVESVAEIVFNDIRDFPGDEPMTSSDIRELVEDYSEQNGLSPAQVSQVAELVNEMLEDGTDASEAQRDKRREKFLRDTGEYNTMRMGDDEYDSIVEQILEDGTFSPDEANQIRDAYEERSDAIKAATRIKNDDRKSEAIEKASNDYYDKIADIVEGPEGSATLEDIADGEDTFISAIETMLEQLDIDNLERTYDTGDFTAVTEAMFPQFLEEDPANSEDFKSEIAALNKHRERLTDLQEKYNEALASYDKADAEALERGLESFLAELKGERAKRGYDKYIADLREEARQQWEDMTPAELRDWRRDAAEDGYYVGAGSTFDEQEKIYIDMFIEGEATPRAEWEAQQEEGPLGQEVTQAEAGTFDREGFSRGQRRDWYIPEEGDGESIRLDADEVDGFYEIFSASRGMYGARREMDIFRNGGQDAQEEEFDELFDSIEEAQEFVENQLEDLREGERQAERMVEEPAEAPGDAEFDEMFTAPEGAYKPRIFDLYTPRGRTTEDADDYTDDPAVLANKFDAATLGRALKGAVLPDGRQAADGEGLLPFDGGDEMVPAEALYEALQQKGLDADMLLAGMYDSLLDEPVNMDKVKQMREDMGVGPDEAPALAPTAGRDRDEAVRLNQEVAAPTRARRARELMADYEERNAKVTELAQAINDLDDGVTDEVGADDFTRAEFLSRILPWSQGTTEERDAFKGLWGLLQNLGGGDVEEGTALDVPGSGTELESFEGIMTRALDAAFPDRDGREMLDELYDEYGGFADFVDGKSRIADGTDDLDSGSVAASFYRLTRAAARPNRVRLQRTIGVVPGSQLQATYTTPGEVFDMDARSFTSRDLTSEDLLSSMQFAPDSGLTQVVFVAAPGEADSFNASGVSWFGEGEHIGYGTYEVVSVKKVRDLLNPKRDKFAVEVRKARQRDERDIFEDTTPDVSDWQMVGGQAGSNEGGFYRDPDGNEYYVKVPKSQAHAENEALAAALYELTGTPAARTILGDDNGEMRIVSPLIPGAINELRDRLDDEDYIKQLRDGFVVDAWLANWDVAGLMFDNVMSDEDGNPVRVDPGGALMFRARGSEKGSNFGDRVGELDTLRDRDLNPQNSMVFGGVTDAELADQANRLRAIEPEAVDAVVDSIVTDPEMASTLKTRLRNRRADIIRRILGVDESDRDKPVATTTESVSSRDLQAGDILNDGSFVVESAFVDDETPDGMVSVQGYYPGGQSQRLNFSADDLNDVARGGKTPPKGDMAPLHRPEIAPDATPEEVEAWRDELARFEVDKAVRAAMNCGGSGLTAAVGPENGPCSVPSVDELIKKASANPGDKAPQELPDKDGVDVSSAKFASALKDAKKAVKETLQVIEEDDEVKPVIKKRAKKFVDTFNAIVADFNAGKIDAAEASEKIKAIVPAEDRANDDIDFIAVEFDNVADVLSGEAFKPKQEEGMPPPGVVNPKTGKPLGVSKDGVTIIRPGMLVRDKNGFAGVVARYANPGTADPKSAWHGVHVIGAIDGKQYNKVTWQLTPINPGDDDSIYIEGPDGYTGHKKKGTVIPKGSIKKGFNDWNEKAREFYDKMVEEGKVPKASAPEGAPEAQVDKTPKPIPATFDEITDEKERDLVSEIAASFEKIVTVSPGEASLRDLREKLINGELTLAQIQDELQKELNRVKNEPLVKTFSVSVGKYDLVKTELENIETMTEDLQELGSVFTGDAQASLPPIDLFSVDPDDKTEFWSSMLEVEEKKKQKYEGIAAFARLLSRKYITVPLIDGKRETFEKVARMISKSKGNWSGLPVQDPQRFVDAASDAVRRVVASDPLLAVATAARGLAMNENGLIPDVSGEKRATYDELAKSILDLKEFAATMTEISDLDLKTSGSAVTSRQNMVRASNKDLQNIISQIDKMITDLRGVNLEFNNKYLRARFSEINRRKDLRELESAEGFNPRVPEARDLDANPVDWSTPATPAVLSLDEAASRALAIQKQRESEPASTGRTTSDIVQTLGDGSDIEDMVINVVTGVPESPSILDRDGDNKVDPTSKYMTRYQFKLTAWAADTFFADKVENGDDFTSSREIMTPYTRFMQTGTFSGYDRPVQAFSVRELERDEALYGEKTNGTYEAFIDIDGVEVNLTYIRARGNRDVVGKAYDGQVTIDIPAGTPSSVAAKAFQYMGVRDPSTTKQEDIQLLVENRLISVLGGDSNASRYISDPVMRKDVLDRVFDTYGVRADDFEVRVAPSGKVDIVGPESLGKAVRNATEIDMLFHTINTTTHDENGKLLGEQEVNDAYARIVNGFSNIMKPGQGLRSTVSRWLRGSPEVGQSSLRDTETGGADYVFMTPSSSRGSMSSYLYQGMTYSGIGIVYNPDELFRRIDWTANVEDQYGGRDKVAGYDPSVDFDFVVERATPRSHEVMFKGDVANDAIAFIVVDGKERKDKLVQALKDKGIESIGGQPVEVVVTHGIIKDSEARDGNKFTSRIADQEYINALGGY